MGAANCVGCGDEDGQTLEKPKTIEKIEKPIKMSMGFNPQTPGEGKEKYSEVPKMQFVDEEEPEEKKAERLAQEAKLKEKLDKIWEVYDTDGNGVLDKTEGFKFLK